MIGSFHLDGMPEMLDGQLHALLLHAPVAG